MSENDGTQKYLYKKIMSILLPVFLLILFAWFIWMNGYRFSKNKTEEPPETIINIHTMESSFQEAASLATEEYNFTNVGTLDEEKRKLFFISLPFTGKKCLMIYSGVIKAGIKDVSQITVDEPDDVHKIIVINCPRIELFDDPVIYPESIEIYDVQESVFSHFTPDDFADFEVSEQDAARQMAINNGLLTKAKEHARELLTSQGKALLLNTAYKDYIIDVVFEDE